MNRVEFIKVETSKRRIYEDDKVPGSSGEVVEVISICAVCNTREPIDYGDEHDYEGSEVQCAFE